MTPGRVAVAVAGLLVAVVLVLWLRLEPPGSDEDQASAPASEPDREAAIRSAAEAADVAAAGDAARENDAEAASAGDPTITCIRALTAALDYQEEQLDANGGRRESEVAAAETLAVSSDPEHRLAVALLLRSSPPPGGVPYPPPDVTDPLQLWHALIGCDRPTSGACPTAELEQALIAVDGSNSEAWAVAAFGRYRRGDRNGALAALQQAGAVAESNSYWTETIELIDRALIAATDYEYRSRAALALGASTYAVHDIWAIQEMCEESSVSSVDWALACEAAERRLLEQELPPVLERIGLPECTDELL